MRLAARPLATSSVWSWIGAPFVPTKHEGLSSTPPTDKSAAYSTPLLPLEQRSLPLAHADAQSRGGHNGAAAEQIVQQRATRAAPLIPRAGCHELSHPPFT